MADLPILEELRHELREAGRREAPVPSRRRSWWRPAIAVAAAGFAAVFVVVVGPQGANELTSSQKPVPAGTLKHVTYAEGRGDNVRTVELWATDDGCRARSVVERPPGTPWGEFTQAPGETRSWNAKPNRLTVAQQDPALVLVPYDPGESARRYLRSHPSRIVGRAERFGRPMVWREVRGGPTQRFLTDAKSYEVWDMRTLRKGKEIHRMTIFSREDVKYDPKLLEMSPHPDAEVQRIKRPAVSGKQPRVGCR